MRHVRPPYWETDAFYGLQTPVIFLANRLKSGQITVIYGSKDWKLSRICFPYEPEERADIDPAREWIGGMLFAPTEIRRDIHRPTLIPLEVSDGKNVLLYFWNLRAVRGRRLSPLCRNGRWVEHNPHRTDAIDSDPVLITVESPSRNPLTIHKGSFLDRVGKNPSLEAGVLRSE